MAIEAVEQVILSDERAESQGLSVATRVGLLIGGLLLMAVVVWQALTSGGSPDPLSADTTKASAVIDIAVLVFREGLECVLVIAAITASLVGNSEGYRRPITVGIVIAGIATLITWKIAVTILTGLLENHNALQVQAATGLVAIIVLLVVMNWFFHKVYWTGWISMHNRRKRDLIKHAANPSISKSRLFLGFVLLGFTSLYREGFEVVLFLQSYRLKVPQDQVYKGVLLGVVLSAIVAVLAFVANRRLPFRKMLIATGIMLGIVLLVMIGEQAQEMQLAGWLPNMPIKSLEGIFPSWIGLWFAIFPTVETLVAQAIALTLVVGSYVMVRRQHARAVETARHAG